MSKSKDIEVKFKVPIDYLTRNQLDVMQNILGLSQTKVRNDVFSRAVDKIMKEIKIPKIKINKDEVKDRMLTIMAERALDGDDE